MKPIRTANPLVSLQNRRQEIRRELARIQSQIAKTESQLARLPMQSHRKVA